ncbi:MAG: hypothetical protein FWD49_05160 [Firmicutes bacterium]|nr:hypothetical protein [Bacillota bacterium]
MRIYRYTPTLPPKAEGWGYRVCVFSFAVCAVGFTHGYAYPARFGAVTDLSIY